MTLAISSDVPRPLRRSAVLLRRFVRAQIHFPGFLLISLALTLMMMAFAVLIGNPIHAAVGPD